MGATGQSGTTGCALYLLAVRRRRASAPKLRSLACCLPVWTLMEPRKMEVPLPPAVAPPTFGSVVGGFMARLPSTWP